MRLAASAVLVCALATAASAEKSPAKPHVEPRCEVSVHKATLEVDGKRASRPQVVAACKRTKRAFVTLDTDYGKGLWKALEKDLEAAKIHVSTLPRECFENPLAKGCE